MTRPTIKLAIYDMDKTLTERATWTGFLLAAARTAAPWRLALLPAVGLAGGAYAARLIDRTRLKETSQRLLLGHAVPAATMRVLAGAFAERVTHAGVFAAARAQIAADRAAGCRIVMATASHRFYAAAIGERLGMDDVIATNARLGPGDAVTFRIDGENCYGPAKLRMIEAWLRREGIAREAAHVRFYSDHVSDAPALAWADEPFAVNPHAKLRRLAKQRGWPVLDWRRDRRAKVTPGSHE